MGRVGASRLNLNPAEVGVLVSDWWDEVNESIQWQDGIFYSLCGAYALVASVALVSFSPSLYLYCCLLIFL
ncbi:hypothetical protein CRG98_007294 [Punica granatum]|uniref:THH1/TOM1/TOM3 domain-containing protein n=1 Tax=Punica granatum TaxID=22663 RepID=A0A2I0KV26_PUNGR|nr:hypothetical protein CRG98_007294 [Punica granatum]